VTARGSGGWAVMLIMVFLAAVGATPMTKDGSPCGAVAIFRLIIDLAADHLLERRDRIARRSASSAAAVAHAAPGKPASFATCAKSCRRRSPRTCASTFCAGTSVGAMTCCYLAARWTTPTSRAGASPRCGRACRSSRSSRSRRIGWSVGRKMWKATRNNEHPDGWRLYDLLHPEPLENMVNQRIAWPRIAANLAKGTFDAISVSTTRIRDGRTQVFVQRREPGLPEWSRDPWTVATEVVLSPEHALASAAIPLLFRSVKIGDEYYCDGFVRQNTPSLPRCGWAPIGC
jgi:hypothetical protein